MSRKVISTILLSTVIGLAGLINNPSVSALDRFHIADSDTKTEDKNGANDSQSIGTLKVDATYEVRGSLGSQLGRSDKIDLVDNYTFRVLKPGRYVFALGGGAKPGSAELRLYTSTTLIGNKQPGQPIDKVLPIGTYRLEAFRTPFAKGAFDYGFSIGTPQSP